MKMRKLLLLIVALLAGASGALAETGTITVKGSSDTSFDANGTFSKCKTTWATMWQSNTTPCLTITSTNHSRYMSGTLLAYADYAMFLPWGYRITGYTISFKSNADGNSKITGYGEKKASKGSATSTGTTDVQTLTVSGISTQSVEFKVETNYANVTLFTVTYETVDDVMPFVQGGYYRLKEYSSWVTNYYLYAYRSDTNTDRLKKGSATADKVLTHSNYIWKASSVSGSQVQFQNELYGYYMAKLPTSAGQVAASITSNIDDAETFNVINRSAWGAGYISLLAQSPITTAMTVDQGDDISYPFHFLDGCSSSDSLMNGLNYEHQGDVLSVTRVKKVTFSSAVTVNGVSVSTIYVATDGSESITLPANYKYTIGGVEMNALQAATTITAAGTSDINVIVSSPILVGDQKYRIQQAWTTARFYLYANTSDGSNGNRLWKSTTRPAVTNANYIWQAKSSDSNWKLYNLAERYIAKATSTSVDGTGVNALNASSADDAETFTLVSAESCGYPPSDYTSKCYVALKSNSQTNTYLNSYSSTNNYVGWHNAIHAGYYFSFIPVKTVTFSNAVPVNGGDAVTTIYVAKDGSDSFTLSSNYQYSFDNGENYVFASEAATTIASAGTSDLTVTVQDNTPITVNYYVYLGGLQVDSQEGVSAYRGDAPVVPSSLSRDFCSYEYYSDEDCETSLSTFTGSETDVYVKATWTGPFTISQDFASITDWYFLKLKDQRYATYESASDPNVTLNQTSPNVDTRWAFVGNPYNGFRIYNKTAGSSVVLASATATSGNTGGNAHTRMVAVDNATYTYNTWTIKESNAISGVTGFYIYNSEGYALNYRANANLAYWTGGTGDGSTFSVEPDNINFAESVAAYSSYFEDANKDKYFGISTSAAAELQSNYDSFSASCTEDQYLTFRDALNSAIRIPATGYYRMKNTTGDIYFGVTTGPVGVASNTGAETIVKLTNNGNGTFYLSAQGKYVNMPDVQAGAQLILGDAGGALQYEIPEAGSVIFSYAEGNWTNKSLCLTDGIVKNGLASAEGSRWELSDATTFTGTLTNAKDNSGTTRSYATLCVPFNITGITGASAYIPTLDGRYLTMGEGATTIAAGTPVILVGAKNVGSYTATIGDTYVPSPVAASASNALSGTFTSTALDCTDATGENYVLGFDEDNGNRIGFYHVANASFPLKANRAYMTIGGGSAKGFAISFDETAVTSLKDGQTKDNAIFNLAGQRVNKANKGIYIVGGKKVVVK